MQHNSANPRAPLALKSPLTCLNTEEEAEFVYWHLELQYLDGQSSLTGKKVSLSRGQNSVISVQSGS